MTKKIILIVISGTILAAGIAAWFVPIGIDAKYTGKTVYQSETISKSDVDVYSVSLLGRRTGISEFKMEPASAEGEDLGFDISSGNMSTHLRRPSGNSR